MDHNEAVRLQAAEKYVLGELPQDLREAYEEHYFDCAECALDVKAAAAFVDASRHVFQTEPVPVESESKGLVKGWSGWLAWLRPAFAVPALAALLLVVSYQNLVTIPQAKRDLALNAGQVITSSFSLQMANVRGGEEVKVRVHPNEGFSLKFDFTPSQSFESYMCELQDASGHSLLREMLPGTSTNKEAELAVRGGLVKPGKYALVFTGAPGSSGGGNQQEVLRLGFSVEFLP